jgi:sterol desaturase/sphingolipid hydroxylase (fatty acid hydroxylase superfamily)
MICVRAEFRHPFLRPRFKTLKKSYRTNVFTFLFNDISLSLLSIPSLYFIAQQFAGHGLLTFVADGPTKYLLIFLLLDLTLYGWHYATHHCDRLWVFHKVHRSDRSFNVTTGLRFHFGELFLEVLVRVAFIALLGVSATAVLVNQTLILLFVMFHHTNVSFPGERVVARMLIVPSLHRLHHSAVRIEHDSNYGAVRCCRSGTGCWEHCGKGSRNLSVSWTSMNRSSSIWSDTDSAARMAISVQKCWWNPRSRLERERTPKFLHWLLRLAES